VVPIREFITAVQDAHDEDEVDEGRTLKLDGEVLRYYKPVEGQVLLYMAQTGRHASRDDRVAAIINFFMELFDERSREHLVGRLMDRDDPFGVRTVEEIMEALIEEWVGRPTQSPSVSARSQRSGGPRSTARTRKSTSSDSPSTVS